MKYPILILLILHRYILGQEAYKPEYFLQTNYVSSSTTINFYLSKISVVLCHPRHIYTQWNTCLDCPDTAIETIEGTYSGFGRGFEICWDGPFDEWDPIGYGLYKMIIDRTGSNAHFYLDMRDANYSHNGYVTTDFTIRYDYNMDMFEWTDIGAMILPPYSRQIEKQLYLMNSKKYRSNNDRETTTKKL